MIDIAFGVRAAGSRQGSRSRRRDVEAQARMIDDEAPVGEHVDTQDHRGLFGVKPRMPKSRDRRYGPSCAWPFASPIDSAAIGASTLGIAWLVAPLISVALTTPGLSG